MITKQLDRVGQSSLIRRHHPAIAEAAEVFRREETEAAEVAYGAGATPLVFSADGLRCVLYDVEVVARCDLHNRVHVGHLPVKMHGDDGARFVCDGRFDFRRVYVVGERVNIYKDGLRAQTRDRASRGEEGIGGRDNFVAGLDADCHQGHQQGVRA